MTTKRKLEALFEALHLLDSNAMISPQAAEDSLLRIVGEANQAGFTVHKAGLRYEVNRVVPATRSPKGARRR